MKEKTQEDNLAYLVVGAAVLVAAALAVEDSAESN
jgi:hypothetical protein